MGYYTGITLTMHGSPDAVKAAEDDMRNNWDKDLAEDILNNDGYLKWHWVEGLFDKLAADHPEVLIQVTGYGEEQDDIWEQRWKGKLTVKQFATIPPFAEPELQISEH